MTPTPGSDRCLAPDPAHALGDPTTEPDGPFSGTAAPGESTPGGTGAVSASCATPADLLLVDARQVLCDWRAPSPTQEGMRGRYLAFLDEHPNAASRDQRAGHLTASTVVLDHSRERVLLTLHPGAGRWFQLGGHVEPDDATMAAAALREATEESGIGGLVLHPTPIGLDWHAVRCRTTVGVTEPSSHLDVEYVAVAPPGAEHVRSHESLDLAWFGLDALPEGADDVVRSLVRRVRELGLP